MNTLLVYFVLIGIATAQTFTFSAEDTLIIASPTVADVITAGLLTNTGSTPINLIAKRRVNVADTTWKTAICMAICMGPQVDTAGAYDIAPGATQLFLLHFTPSASPSNGNVLMEFYSTADTTHRISRWFHLTTDSPTQFTFPSQGKMLPFATADTLRWTSAITGSAQLSFSSDAGEHWTEIAPSVPLSAGMYVWTPGLQFINNAKLRLHSSSGNVFSDLTKITAQFFAPLSGAVLHSATPDTIQWTPGVSGTAEFDYQINGGPWVKVTSGVNMSSGKYIWSPPSSINNTAVRIRLKTADWQFASDPFSVSPKDAVAELIPQQFTVVASPNPTHDIINFHTTVSDLRQIEIIDMLGRVVISVSLSSHPISASLDMTRLPAGLYSGRIVLNDRVSIVPFEVIH